MEDKVKKQIRDQMMERYYEKREKRYHWAPFVIATALWGLIYFILKLII